LAVSVARVIWRDRHAKIADTKIIGIDTQWFIWYNLSSVMPFSHDPMIRMFHCLFIVLKIPLFSMSSSHDPVIRMFHCLFIVLKIPLSPCISVVIQWSECSIVFSLFWESQCFTEDLQPFLQLRIFVPWSAALWKSFIMYSTSHLFGNIKFSVVNINGKENWTQT
jgi:hypothetical protein